MLDANLFEQLLATYPAEKRELARQIYDRFADGDTTQFFTQLFVVLGLYTHYVEDMPHAVMEANKNARAGFLKMREEIALLGQAIDKRNLNITNHATRTEESCRETQEKCDEITDRLDAILKNVGDHIDTDAIVSGVQEALESGIDEKIISPFVQRSEELAKEVMPTLKQIREAVAEARELWPQRIWRTVIISSTMLAAMVTLLATLAIHAKFKIYYEEKVAEKIVTADRLINYNQEAFRQLAIAQVQVKVVRTDDSKGGRNPGGFALIIENADSAEMRQVDGRSNGMIFFTSSSPETLIQNVQQRLEAISKLRKQQAK